MAKTAKKAQPARRAAPAKPKRTPAQIAATKRMLAARRKQVAAAGKTAARKTTTTAKAVAKKTTTAVTTTARKVAAVARTPINKQTARKAAQVVKHAAKKAKGHAMKKNGIIVRAVLPAAQGAGAAIAVDVAINKLPLPQNVKFGLLRHVVKGAAVLGTAMLLEKAGKKAMAQNVAIGGTAVVIAEAGLALMAQAGVNLGEVGALEEMNAAEVYGDEVAGIDYYEDGMGEVDDDVHLGETIDGEATKLF